MDGLDEWVLVIFRLSSAVVFTLVAAFMSYKLARRALLPRPVWTYVAVVLWVVTLFRWFVVLLLIDHDSPVVAAVAPYIPPLTQSMFILLAMAIFVLTYCHIRQRALHWATHDHSVEVLLEEVQAARGTKGTLSE